MNALAPESTPPVPTCRAVALLVDGDNMGCDLAGRMIVAARQSLGHLAVQRVYGDARQLNGWAEAPGFRLVQAHAGKNVTDMLLTVEAMELSYGGAIDGFAIATRDRDFAPLAWSLRARGLPVLALTSGQAPPRLVAACSGHFDLSPPPAEPTDNRDEPLEPVSVSSDLLLAVGAVLRDGPLELAAFGQAMRRRGVVKPVGSKWKTLLAPLSGHVELIPAGATHRVTLVSPVPA